jgi:hypothetical protein
MRLKSTLRLMLFYNQYFFQLSFVLNKQNSDVGLQKASRICYIKFKIISKF